MLSKKYFCVFFMALISGNAFALTISPETTASVNLSNKDVNRFVCHNGDINDVYFSEEKGIQVSRKGKDAFVKFLIKSRGNKSSYVKTKSEFYVVCGGDVYTIIAEPKDLSAKTIHLSNPNKHKIEENVKNFGSLPIEQRAVDLTKRVIMDETPDSFNVKKIGINNERWQNNIIKGLELLKTREVSIEGVGLRLSEFVIIANHNMNLKETAFLDTRLGKSIVAVTLEDLTLKKGNSTKLYLVERNV